MANWDQTCDEDRGLIMWIRLDDSLFRPHPKAAELVYKLKPMAASAVDNTDRPATIDEAISFMIRLWLFAAQESPIDGDLTRYEGTLHRWLHTEDWFASVSDLLEVRVLERTEDGRLLVRGWYERQGRFLEARLKDAARPHSSVRSPAGNAPGEKPEGAGKPSGTSTSTLTIGETSLEKKSSSSRGADSAFVKKVIEYWGKKKLRPHVCSVSDARRAAILARRREHGGEMVMTALKNRAKSNFLCNIYHDGRGAPIDFVFGPKNFSKVADGNYANATIKQGGVPNGSGTDYDSML